jgi:pimeloyl-ACP methyl ester carboxylesterase
MEKTVSHSGQPIRYESAGTGLPVMLVHGFTEDRTIWDPLVSAIPGKYRWLIPDLPGSGQSPYNKDLAGIPDLADALQAILQEERIEKMAIIGHSMGGYISLSFAEKFPEALLGLGLFHSTAYADTPEKKISREKSIQFIRQHRSAPYVQQSLPGLFSEHFKNEHPEKIREQVNRYANCNPDSLVQYLEFMAEREDKTTVLINSMVPVLFILGEEDKAVPLKSGLEQCHLARISYIHILAHTAHMGMLENTSLCNSYVDRFLDQIPV